MVTLDDNTALVLIALINLAGAIFAGHRSSGARKSSRQAAESADTAKLVTEQVAESIGPTNGDSIKELMAYQQDRNHAIMNQLSAVAHRLDRIGTAQGVAMPTDGTGDPPAIPPRQPRS